MPITDYKVTDIERDAVRMEGKADPLSGTLAQNQAEFDEYAELVRDNLDGLCDYIATMPIAYLSSAAAATANKGAITGFVPLGAILEISMTNGNTSASPTVSIDGATHTFTNMPTVAQVQANSTQTYRFVKTGATALTFTKNPDYICEYGTRASGHNYKLYASGFGNLDGNTFTPTVTSQSGTLTTTTINTCSYITSGKIVFFNANITLTDKGTGAGELRLTLPFNSKLSCAGSGSESASTGASIRCLTNAGNNTLGILKYDLTTIIATGYQIAVSITYEAE